VQKQHFYTSNSKNNKFYLVNKLRSILTCVWQDSACSSWFCRTVDIEIEAVCRTPPSNVSSNSVCACTFYCT